jgi:hypothetical protein
MQGIENRTDLMGTIVSRQPHPELADYDVLGVRVQEARPVDGVADLLSSTVGSELSVTVRRALLDHNAQPGATIRSRAKRTPEGAMADTYPEPGGFAIGGAVPELGGQAPDGSAEQPGR